MGMFVSSETFSRFNAASLDQTEPPTMMTGFFEDFNCSTYIAKSSFVGPDFGIVTKLIGFSSTSSLNMSSGNVIITGPGLPLKLV